MRERERLIGQVIYEWRINMDTLALVLVIIGALNWGLVSLFQYDLVASLFGGSDAFLSRLVYGLVALAGIYCIKFFMDRDRVKE
jgi:uncharacterized membrane protein YuzA (DUF378 family)